MQRVAMLATPDGEWVFEDSPEFLAALGDPDPDYDAALFAVKNLGFIRFEMLGNSVIEIELHPRNVALPALLAVQEQLQSSRIKLFRIKYFTTVWQSEIFPAAERAMLRLSALCTPDFTPPPSERYQATPQNYSLLFRDQTSPLKLLAQKWRTSFGQFDSTVISFAIKHQLISRLMIFGVKPGSGEAVFRFIGDGFKWLDDEYALKGIGERVENQPDKDYGSWVAGFYRHVAASREPRYDNITAVIQPRPGAKPYVSRYERLLLPWSTPSREIFVSMLSRRVSGGSPVEEVAERGRSSPQESMSSKSS